MEKNTLDIINEVIKQCSVSGSSGEILGHILRWIEVLWIDTTGKSKADIQQELEGLMDTLPTWNQESSEKIFILFTNDYVNIEDVKDQILKEAILRNTYRTKYNHNEQIKATLEQLNYSIEPLSHGKRITINEKEYALWNSAGECKFKDMRKHGEFSMDSILNTERYKALQEETGMNKLYPDQLYKKLWYFAQAMGITTIVDYDFFKSPWVWYGKDSDESQKLLQMYRNITGIEGRLPISLLDDWNVEYLYFNNSYCGLFASRFVDINNTNLILWEREEEKESSETVSEYIDAQYIDGLLKDTELTDQSRKQLNNIKKLIRDNPNSTLKKERLTIEYDLVTIDGFWLPIEITNQSYDEMSEEDSTKLYPEFAIALLNFTAAVKGLQFDRGSLNNKNLIDGSLDQKDIMTILNTDNNIDILQWLSNIVDIDPSYIPMGIDCNGYVICADLSSDSTWFFSDNGSIPYYFPCLVNQ